MLWMVVWAAYLSGLRLLEMSPRVATVLTIWLAALLAVQSKWGYERGFPIAVLGTTVLFPICFVLLFMQPVRYGDLLLEVIFFIAWSCVAGSLMGLCGFLAAYWAVNALDWTDGLMVRK